eukprot:8712290-Pyramimonas_sp.AAC.1
MAGRPEASAREGRVHPRCQAAHFCRSPGGEAPRLNRGHAHLDQALAGVQFWAPRGTQRITGAHEIVEVAPKIEHE